MLALIKSDKIKYNTIQYIQLLHILALNFQKQRHSLKLCAALFAEFGRIRIRISVYKRLA